MAVSVSKTSSGKSKLPVVPKPVTAQKPKTKGKEKEVPQTQWACVNKTHAVQIAGLALIYWDETAGRYKSAGQHPYTDCPIWRKYPELFDPIGSDTTQWSFTPGPEHYYNAELPKQNILPYTFLNIVRELNKLDPVPRPGSASQSVRSDPAEPVEPTASAVTERTAVAESQVTVKPTQTEESEDEDSNKDEDEAAVEQEVRDSPDVPEPRTVTPPNHPPENPDPILSAPYRSRVLTPISEQPPVAALPIQTGSTAGPSASTSAAHTAATHPGTGSSPSGAYNPTHSGSGNTPPRLLA